MTFKQEQQEVFEEWERDHLSLQQLPLQARAVLLRAVGPADGQAVGLPLLLGLAGAGAAAALHWHGSDVGRSEGTQRGGLDLAAWLV